MKRHSSAPLHQALDVVLIVALDEVLANDTRELTEPRLMVEVDVSSHRLTGCTQYVLPTMVLEVQRSAETSDGLAAMNSRRA